MAKGNNLTLGPRMNHATMQSRWAAVQQAELAKPISFARSANLTAELFPAWSWPVWCARGHTRQNFPHARHTLPTSVFAVHPSRRRNSSQLTGELAKLSVERSEGHRSQSNRE